MCVGMLDITKLASSVPHAWQVWGKGSHLSPGDKISRLGVGCVFFTG